VTGADVNFEHRSYHCATLTAHLGVNVTYAGFVEISTLRKKGSKGVLTGTSGFFASLQILCTVPLESLGFFGDYNVPKGLCGVLSSSDPTGYVVKNPPLPIGSSAVTVLCFITLLFICR
jgi:hypothetical protein